MALWHQPVNKDPILEVDVDHVLDVVSDPKYSEHARWEKSHRQALVAPREFIAPESIEFTFTPEASLRRRSPFPSTASSSSDDASYKPVRIAAILPKAPHKYEFAPNIWPLPTTAVEAEQPPDGAPQPPEAPKAPGEDRPQGHSG